MLIDWFTVAAQVLNFLVLVWLLKRFLYQPILDAIDAREQRIAAEIADAAATRTEAEQARSRFEDKNATFDAQRADLLAEAKAAAKTELERLTDEAREDANAQRTRWQQALLNERESLSQALSLRTREEVFAIAHKVLTDLAGTDLQERLTEVFTRRLREMNAEAKAALAHALDTASEPAQLRSAFALPAAQRVAIETALHEGFATSIPIRFETVPDLVSGIELVANGQKLAWSITDYLDSIGKRADTLLEAREAPGAGAQPEPEEDADPGKPPP